MRLNAAQRDNIRNVRGFTAQEIANVYGVSVAYVRRLRRDSHPE